MPIFFGHMIATNWPGQFNFDFKKFVLLSGLWVSWRHHFSMGGIALGIAAFFRWDNVPFFPSFRKLGDKGGC
jgi:hypothetical protein